LLKADKKGLYDQVVDALDLTTILERKAVELSGGEL